MGEFYEWTKLIEENRRCPLSPKSFEGFEGQRGGDGFIDGLSIVIHPKIEAALPSLEYMNCWPPQLGPRLHGGHPGADELSSLAPSLTLLQQVATNPQVKIIEIGKIHVYKNSDNLW